MRNHPTTKSLSDLSELINQSVSNTYNSRWWESSFSRCIWKTFGKRLQRAGFWKKNNNKISFSHYFSAEIVLHLGFYIIGVLLYESIPFLFSCRQLVGAVLEILFTCSPSLVIHCHNCCRTHHCWQKSKPYKISLDIVHPLNDLYFI